MQPASSSLSAKSTSKKRKITQALIAPPSTTVLSLVNYASSHAPADEDMPARMEKLLFHERTRIPLDINPAYVSRLENSRELGYYPNPANKTMTFTPYELRVTELRRCMTQVLTRALTIRYHDRSNLRNTEIDAELALIVPLTVRACMCAIYAKLQQIHHQHGRLSTRYPTPPHYIKEIELPLPLAIAIQELGMFQTASLEQNILFAPTYPEATRYEGRDQDEFNISDYQTHIPTYKDLGIPCKSVDSNIEKGSAWWTYHIRNSEGTTDLVCNMPPTNYTELAASLRMLFLATEDNQSTCNEIVNWPEDMEDYGSHARELYPNSNTRAFLALCHGPKEEWSNGINA